jgi:cytochrome P450
MSEFAPVMVDTAREICERWARLEPPAGIDALSEMAQLTAEIICRTVFGRDLGRDRALEVVKGFTEYQHRIGQFDLLSLLGVPEWLPRPRLPGVYRSVRRIHKVLDQLVAEHRAHRDRGEASIMRHLLDARDEETGEPLDDRALRNEAAVLLLAGHETTASSLAWTWYILSQTPEIEANLHSEIDGVLRGQLPTYADVPKLIYIRAIFEEVLRLYPPIPLLTREAVRDEVFGDCPIPKGSLIVVCPWLLHRSPRLWHMPDHFLPHRFLPGGHRPPSKFAYVPFSVGPRTCIGMAFGMTEAILCIATIAQAFMLRVEPGHRVEVACRLTIRPGEKLPMRLYPTSRHIRLHRQLIEESGLFDRDFYLAQSPELASFGIDAIYHYLQYGAMEGQTPTRCSKATGIYVAILMCGLSASIRSCITSKRARSKAGIYRRYSTQSGISDNIRTFVPRGLTRSYTTSKVERRKDETHPRCSIRIGISSNIRTSPSTRSSIISSTEPAKAVTRHLYLM